MVSLVASLYAPSNPSFAVAGSAAALDDISQNKGDNNSMQGEQREHPINKERLKARGTYVTPAGN